MAGREEDRLLVAAQEEPGGNKRREVPPEKAADVGLVGYEINFNRYFYRFRPPRPLGEIEADIRRIEREMVAMLRKVAGPSSSGPRSSSRLEREREG